MPGVRRGEPSRAGVRRNGMRIIACALLVAALTACGSEAAPTAEPTTEPTKIDTPTTGKMSPAGALAVQKWLLDRVVEGDTDRPVPAGEDVELSFDGEGRATITGLCNGWSAEVEVTADAVTWSPGPRTLMACADEARMALDSEVSQLLTGATTYAVGEHDLTVERGEAGLTFTAVR